MKRPVIFLAAWLLAYSLALGAPTLRDSGLSVSEIVSGLSLPTTMAFIGADDILVLQKDNGQVRRVAGGVLQASPVLDVAVDNDSERGMLGIAVHPNFPSSPFVYLYYTESSTAGDSSGAPEANRVYRYTWNGATLTSPLLVLDLPVTPGPNHDGGVIAFGPDGKLYVVIGDLNRNGQLQNFSSGAPDDSSVILRVNDDGSAPNDNPFFSQGGSLAKYFAYGIRNSFGMAFDPLTDRLWMTENGPNLFDEINLVEPGFNSGWEKLMGPDARNSNDAADLFSISGSHYADPKFSWLDTVGVTAIAFLDSTALGPQYENNAFVGDINNGNLYRFTPNGARNGFVFSGAGLADLVADSSAELNETILGEGFAGITDLKVGPDGRLYVVSFGDGKIYAISNVTVPPSFGIDALPAAEVGVAYNADLDITGGSPPFNVSVIAGALPPGLNLSGETISGSLAAAQGARFTLQVTDDLGASATRRFKISAVGAVSINNDSLPAGRVGRSYKARLNGRSGKKPFTWSLVSGSLPAGLLFDTTTGRISGIPTTTGNTDLTFRLTDTLGGVAQKTLTLSVQ
jgi:glucose/arabinose dehydrogenase